MFSKGQNIEMKRRSVVTGVIKNCREGRVCKEDFFREMEQFCGMILVVVQEPINVIKLHRASYQNQRAHRKIDV